MTLIEETPGNRSRGESGGTRRALKNRTRSREHRAFLRMINAGWIPPDKDVAEVRETIAQIAKDKTDARAAVMAANFLFNAEAAVIQSALAIHAAQIDQDPEDSDEEDGEHTCRPGEHDFRGIPGNVDPSISVDAETP